MSVTYFVYIDWTREKTPRPFYVGKGKIGRVKQPKRNKHHGNIVRKYGQDRKIVLATINKKKAIRLEINLIKKLGTFVLSHNWNGFGCNYTKGGDGAAGRRFVMSQERKKKIAIALIGNKNGVGHFRSEEQKKQISRKLIGHKVASATRKKISNKLKGVKLGQERVKKSAKAHIGLGKPVIQFINNKIIAEFPSAKIAQDITGIHRSKICNVCKDRRKSAGGYEWKYAIKVWKTTSKTLPGECQ